tara:strand:+ start:2679 stop:3161 length:483 start_codon:yes stop_codon:yes gene_type:complete
MDEYLPHIPTIDVLNPPQTIFDVPVADVPYLDPVLLPSLEQVESGLGSSGSSVEEETSSSKEEALELVPETIPTNLPDPKETLSTEEPVATFNIPFFGEMPIPAPEVIASSVIASSVSATAAVTGSIVLQSVINQLKKIMTKIFKKVLKKEIANQKKDQS